MAKISKNEIYQKAIDIAQTIKSENENAVVFITPKIAFRMRNLIKQLRRNYYGIFEEPFDSVTGRRKIWFPLTEVMVDNVIKNIDLDTKDINFRAKKREALGLTALIRHIFKNKLDEIFFGEKLDELIRDLVINGTAIWKTYEVYNEKTKKKEIVIESIDLLNFYIDGTVKSIQEAPIVMERSLMTKEEIQQMNWINTENLEPIVNLSKVADNLVASSISTKESSGKYIDIYEIWGRIPLWLITGEEKDKKSGEEVEGRIVVSGLENVGNERVHLIEINKTGLKPYEEIWYRRVPNRWYGRGIAEKLLMLQTYLNIVGNLRINKARISQLGLFKIRKNKGITPRMLNRLVSNGVIVVDDMNDIEQLVMQDVPVSSYNDEKIIMNWASRITSAFETVTGESLPASTPVTNAVLQARASQSDFVLVKKQIGFSLQRWIKRHALSKIMKRITRGEIIRITGDIDNLRDYDERIINELLYRELVKMKKEGKFIKPEDIQREREIIKNKLSKMGKDRFVRIGQENIDYTQYDVQVFITNEEIDKAVLVQNLLSMLQLVAQIPNLNISPEIIVRQILDLMGLDSDQLNIDLNNLQNQRNNIENQQSNEESAKNINKVTDILKSLNKKPNEQSVVTEANIIK